MPSAGSFCEEDEAEGGAAAAASEAPKLCGYLQKLSGKGPLRGFRSRWFVFDPRHCALYYFKGPQEAQPLGRLDIASAAFSYHQLPEAAVASFSSSSGSCSIAAPIAVGDAEAASGTAFEIHIPGGVVAVLKVGPPAGVCASDRGPLPPPSPLRRGWLRP